MVAIFSITFILLFAMYSESTIPAVAESLQTFFAAVLPSLFPFYVAASVLRKTSFCRKVSKGAEYILRPLFGISGEGAIAAVIGFLCGYPAGAAISGELYREGKISLEDAVRLSSFINNTGPLFLIGTVGAKMFGSARFGVILWAGHVISSLLCGLIVCNIRSVRKPQKSLLASTPARVIPSVGSKGESFGKILSEAMSSSMYTMIPVAAAIVFFAALNAVCEESGLYGLLGNLLSGVVSKEVSCGLFKGVLEITGGISCLSGINALKTLVAALVSFLSGFAGLSIHFQVGGVYLATGIPCKTFVISKLLHGVLACIITSILFCL